MMRAFKRRVFNRLRQSFIYPHIFFVPSPFKMFEFRELVRVGDIQPDDTLLDVGSGGGVQTALFGRRCRKIVGIDISEGAVGRAKSEQHLFRGKADVEFRVTSIEDAGFEADKFDKVVSVCVMEHVADDNSVLRECFRVLKPGGRLVMSIDSLSLIEDRELLEMHRREYFVRRYYRPEEIRAKLEEIGFADVTVTPALRSALAKRWFSWGIRHHFRFRYSGGLWRYGVLRCIEPFCKGDKSIYLIIAARKPNKEAGAAP